MEQQILVRKKESKVYKSDEIKIIKIEYAEDKIGQEIEIKKEKTVYCDIESISSKEWHQAGNKGMKPELKIIMPKPDYTGETMAEVEGKEYTIYRTYAQKKSEDIELYLTKKVGTCKT